MEEIKMNETERIKANDPFALKEKGNKCSQEQDYDGAFQYWTKAAQLGDIEAHYNLSSLYGAGKGVEKDEKKCAYHLEEAAIGGHPVARLKLIALESKHERYESVMKHLMIAAKLGDDVALEKVKQSFFMGVVTKEDYAAALRGHQAAVDATKSEQRDAAEEYHKRHRLAPDEWYKRRDLAEELFKQGNQN
jgi:TPR repeat protein